MRPAVDAASIAGEFSLVELADVIAASRLVVSVNTGVMHLASLLGAATVSLEGPGRRSTVGGRSVRARDPSCRRYPAAAISISDSSMPANVLIVWMA